MKLTPSQIKVLFALASDAQLASEVERLLDTVMAATTSLDELTKLKEQAKVLIEQAATRRDREEARLLYHAAVAAALVRHGTAISGRPIVRQHAIYARFAEARRRDALGQLFRDAARIVQPR
jgi:hypothetical protein